MENEIKPAYITDEDWELAQKLSDEFLVPSECIVRGFKACDRCGIDREVYIGMYLKKNTPERSTELSNAYMQILKEDREKRWILQGSK